MLADELKSLPNSPGVYQYFDASSKLLYVGKAKVLKNRVKSYFSFTPTLAPSPRLSPRIAKMISEAVHIEWIEAPSESDALILENSFIKQLKPKYNILLRDDKTYPYIYIDLSLDFPRFEITRKVIKGKNIKYFGPFFKGAKEILEALYLEFKLVQKKSCLKDKKACLFHQIGRCEAPCIGKISKENYSKIVNEAIKKLKNPELLIENLSNLMSNYAINENYEEAAKLRDSINTIKDISIKVEVDIARLEDFEAIAISCERGFVCSVRLSIRDGKVAFANHTLSKANDISNLDSSSLYKQILLEAFPPDEPVATGKIYTRDEFEDMELVSEILSKRHGKKFNISSPKSGDKKSICNVAFTNASSFIDKHLKTHNYEFLNEIKDYFKLTNLPIKIECFDNSHLFGSAPVAGMIAWELDKFKKEHYRHIHLKTTNDYDQMNEMLTHRALGFEKLSPPDLWVIDGGEALLNLAKNIISSSGANVDIIAISKEKVDAKAHRAKGSANDKIYTEFGKLSLSPNDKKLQFFQRLRDEAHRFAITFHQNTRKKQDMASSKLANLGVSQGSIKKLLNLFENFENIHNASFEEIAKATNKSVATKIFNSKSSY
ncbi:UvrABC nucleotide excision repair complex, subunit UvrC [Campylobacter iguaniorum]|uniref:excinuclease ABC subunit UvrC n=1 Tax=Campylobacter iguaniorum TaxID=1244531 RepID=UPI00073A3FE1|nr:excinuclease ABC subunit UvrC [Campylobacter iguaniorum]ALV24992.1 UvrABC nucleotide excision repair complex, subunit UvrC [Campylobacter iguaniorum]